jgi:flagellar basal body-associated protein FliL
MNENVSKSKSMAIKSIIGIVAFIILAVVGGVLYGVFAGSSTPKTMIAGQEAADEGTAAPSLEANQDPIQPADQVHLNQVTGE